MKERGILFSAPMVRALLAGTKTQTRRVCKVRCPYAPGDRLWVRETWQADPPADGSWAYTAWAGSKPHALSEIPERFRHPAFCLYRAGWLHGDIRWRPAIHMPRWASRITLEITGVRVERLQDISEADAIAEGIERMQPHPLSAARWRHYGSQALHQGYSAAWEFACNSYGSLWESINGAGSWDENPWVWVVEFKALTATEPASRASQQPATHSSHVSEPNYP